MNTDVLLQREQVEAAFISKVYGWMSAALVITGVVAMWAASTPAVLQAIFPASGSMLPFYLLIGAEFGAVIFLSARINKMTAETAGIVFLLYSVLNGLTLSMVFLIYTSSSIASTFLVTAATFGVMSAYGYMTKKDLTSIGNLAFMALIGLIIGSVVNIFLQSEIMYWVITYAGVLIFVALTAYDTQKIKRMAAYDDTQEVSKKKSIMGALTLYLDFVNLFLYLLRFMGDRK
ncbi:Bax inhibitor-1/YccA family protein [Flavicella sp.]|uniref:Bax inhibitor-1/YccA family protein n=1 Tax=Flavicella sp. TaxID=2957742 RepID=UPI002611A36C|nr:Bax inhibitor-1/YccA family protein [Flavicella sp.]MDG1806049.1 Bax inhibitor-1/YccA family protein [Flavicella sp.]